ncbi:MAG: hypothetical protein HON78_02665, partial [Legionellales bacterium]|nr:hypothetical protein [Legionellales bacterium]
MHSYNIEILKDLYDLNLLKDDPAPSHSQDDESSYLRQEGMDQRLSQHDPYAVYSKKISSFDKQYANITPIISSPDTTIDQKREALQELIGLEKEIAGIIKEHTDNADKIDNANTNIKVLENLARISDLIPTIGSIDSNSWLSITSNLASIVASSLNPFATYSNPYSLYHFYSSTTKQDFLELISSNLFMHMVSPYQDNIHQFLALNSTYLATFLGDLLINDNEATGDKDYETTVILNKLQMYLSDNIDNIIYTLNSNESLDLMIEFINIINENEDLKAGISELAAGQKISNPQSFKQQLEDIIKNPATLRPILSLLTKNKIIIKKAVATISWDSLEEESSALKARESLAQSTQETADAIESLTQSTQETADAIESLTQATQETADVTESFATEDDDMQFIKDLTNESFGLFADFDTWEADTDRTTCLPFTSAKDALLFLYYSFNSIDPVEKATAEINIIMGLEANKLTIEQIQAATTGVGMGTNKTVDLFKCYDRAQDIINTTTENSALSTQALKGKAIIAVLRNLRPFIEKAHEDTGKRHKKALANWLTNILTTPSQDITSSQISFGCLNRIRMRTDTTVSLKDAIISMESDNPALKSLAAGKSSLYKLLFEILDNYSSPEYRAGLTSVIMQITPAIYSKDMETVIEQAIQAVAINETFRKKIATDPAMQDSLINILFTDLKHSKKITCQLQQELNLNDESITGLKELIRTGTHTSAEKLAKAVSSTILTKETKKEIDKKTAMLTKLEKEKDKIGKLIINWANEKDRDKTLGELQEFFKLEGRFVDEIKIYVVTMTNQNFSYEDRSSYVFESINYEIRIASEDKITQVGSYLNKNQKLLQNFVDECKEEKIVGIREDTLQQLLQNILKTLTTEIYPGSNTKNNIENIITWFIKEPKDQNELYDQLLQLIIDSESFKTELQKEEIRGIILNLIKDLMIVSKNEVLYINNTSIEWEALNKVIDRCLAHAPNHLESNANGSTVKARMLNILGFFNIEDKTPDVMHDFYDNTFSLI